MVEMRIMIVRLGTAGLKLRVVMVAIGLWESRVLGWGR